jgi:arginine deiminase
MAPKHSPRRLNVTSETGHLEQVIVHTPGAEMERIAPGSLPHLLFEDILWVEHARKEHELMCRVFETVIAEPGGVLQMGDLVTESFASDEARQDFVRNLCLAAPERNLQVFERELSALPPGSLSTFALTGVSDLPIVAQPLPNLMFTRDVAAVVGDHLVLSHPATAARARESAIMNAVVMHHPGFAAYRDHVIRLPEGVTFEGGDLIVVNDRTVLIGHSQRTSFGGVTSIVRALFERTGIRNVIMVNLPKERSCMHLDTVFTFISPDECVVFPPLIGLRGLGNVVRYTPGDGPDDLRCHVHADLAEALTAVLEKAVRFYPCGGNDPLSQQREQWTDGANLFAIAPGVVIGYERNARTFEELGANGFRIVTAEGFLAYHAQSAFSSGERIAIKLDGHELSRGRGGPRCMTLPLSREALS